MVIIATAIIAFGMNTIRTQPDPSARWLDNIRGKAYCVSIHLARHTGRTYRCFDFLDAKVTSCETLEHLRPGISAALERQLVGRVSSPVPIAFLVCDDNGPIDISTITYGFDITQPIEEISAEDAKKYLREYITRKIQSKIAS
jgi:hypothetical protein